MHDPIYEKDSRYAQKLLRTLIMKKIFIIVAIVLMPAVAFANFTIKFENTHDAKLIYFLYWIDHPFKSPRPANLAVGELKTLQSRDLSSEYINGRYYVVWTYDNKMINEMLINIHNDVKRITIRPGNWIFETKNYKSF